MADNAGYTSQYGFQLYDTTGTTEDWNYAQQGAFGYTIEIGPKDGEFHMPYETGFVDQWTGAYAGEGKGGLQEALMIAAESATNPSDHSVIEGTAPAGRVLRVKKEFTTPTSDVCDQAIEPPVYFTGGSGQAILPQSRCVVPRGVQEVAGRARDHDDRAGRAGRSSGTSTRPPGRSSLRARWSPGEINSGAEPDGDAFGRRHGDALRSRASARSTTRSRTRPATPGRSTRTSSSRWPRPRGGCACSSTSPRRTTTTTCTSTGVTPKGIWSRSTSSGNGTGVDEEVVLEREALPPGTYVGEVENYMADGPWTLTIEQFEGQPDQVSPGPRGVDADSCEGTDGTVYETHQVFVDRGQRVSLNMACGQTAA